MSTRDRILQRWIHAKSQREATECIIALAEQERSARQARERASAREGLAGDGR